MTSKLVHDGYEDTIQNLIEQRDVAINHLAKWCVAIQENGYSWDDWDEYYKDACSRPNKLPEIRNLLDSAIESARSS